MVERKSQSRKKKEEESVTLDAQLCLAQAGQTLIDASEMAKFMNETEAMLSIAAGWMELAERFDPNPESGKRRQPLGFSTFPMSKDEDDDDDECDS